MKLFDIPVNDLDLRINDLWYNRWFLLTSGDWKKKDFNTMTVAWGYFGIMWNKPVAAVVVRPTRFTYEYIEKYDDFSLSSFGKEYKEDLGYLGSHSGRDGDKIGETKLTPAQSTAIGSPSFEESELIIECRKIYRDDFKPENFLDPEIDKHYPDKDYHRMYFGEILKISGTQKFKY